MYGKSSQTQISMIMKFASEGQATVKRTNMKPPPVSTFPSGVLVGRAQDAGFFLSGGFV